MKIHKLLILLALFSAGIGLGFASENNPADGIGPLQPLEVPQSEVIDSVNNMGELASPLKYLLFITALSFIPAALIALTSFTRIIVVLSMLRFAFGMQQTPPNSVLLTLALFLTLFTMAPVIEEIHSEVVTPFGQQQISLEQGISKALIPIREFMVRQTREEDLAVILNIAKAPEPETLEEIKTLHLIPAFMLSELKTAFKIGFVLFLPFLLIDLVVASSLMSLGMIMVPPMTIALPIKVLLFVIIDGWALVTQSLLASFN